MEEYVVHSSRFNDGLGHCRQFPLPTPNTSNTQKLVRGKIKIYNIFGKVYFLIQEFSIITKVLSSAFSATALFALGLRMVGKTQDLGGAKFVVPGVLIAAKWCGIYFRSF